MTEVYEKYYLEIVYANIIEILKMSFTILNVIMGQIPRSQFYDSMKNLFKNLSSQVTQFRMEVSTIRTTENRFFPKIYH